MVRNIPSFVFYKFYLIIQKIKTKFLVGGNKYVCKYYKINEYLTLNVIPIFKFVSIYPIGDLRNLRWRPNPKRNTHM
jgi:hypothetical protein